MRVTVCELHCAEGAFARQWEMLAEHIRLHQSDLVVLPEMPAYPWLASRERFDPTFWDQAVHAHDTFLATLPELGATTLLTSRPITEAGLRLNQAFAWNERQGYRPLHAKHYFPQEPGWYEATWFQRGERAYEAQRIGEAHVGVLLCTEVWFSEWARHYGRQGAEIICVPRATGRTSIDRWLVAMRMAALISGAFVLSSNRVGTEEGLAFSGRGWIISPDGDMLAATSEGDPFVTLDIDLRQAREAKRTYPRDVEE
jgi:N-carbamoylputrescine amidase